MKSISTSTHEQEKWDAENPSPYQSLESGDAHQSKTEQQRGTWGTSAASPNAFLRSIQYCGWRVFKTNKEKNFYLHRPLLFVLLLLAGIVALLHVLNMRVSVFNPFAS